MFHPDKKHYIGTLHKYIANERIRFEDLLKMVLGSLNLLLFGLMLESEIGKILHKTLKRVVVN